MKEYIDFASFKSSDEQFMYFQSLGEKEISEAQAYQVVYCKRRALQILQDGGSVKDIFGCLNNHEYLNFLVESYKLLQKRGIYEEALLLSWTSMNMNMISSNYTVDELIHYLSLADREKLKACGDELPDNDSLEVFRGVVNTNNRRTIHRISWTLNKNTAAWFAKDSGRTNRQPHDVPSVYRLTVPPEAVFFYTNCRHEEEVVINPKLCGPSNRLSILPESIQPF